MEQQAEEKLENEPMEQPNESRFVFVPDVNKPDPDASSVTETKEKKLDNEESATPDVGVKVKFCLNANLNVVETPNGEKVEQIFGESRGVTTKHSLARITIPSGKAGLIHYHGSVDEVYYVLSGTGSINYAPVTAEQRGMNLHDKQDKDDVISYWTECQITAKVSKGDSIKIPNHVWNQMENMNGKEDLVLLVSSAAAHIPDCAVNLI